MHSILTEGQVLKSRSIREVQREDLHFLIGNRGPQ